jgi:hypothetical protein
MYAISMMRCPARQRIIEQKDYSRFYYTNRVESIAFLRAKLKSALAVSRIAAGVDVAATLEDVLKVLSRVAKNSIPLNPP